MPETERNDCKICKRSNRLDDMVCCSACEEWIHYGCAGVDKSVRKVKNWKCEACKASIPNPPPPLVLPVTTSSVIPPITSVPNVTNPAFVTSEAISPTTVAGVVVDNVISPISSNSTLFSEQTKATLRQLQGLQEQQAMLEREMEVQHKLELERKKQHLAWAISNARGKILLNEEVDVTTMTSFEQSGVGRVEEWMRRVEHQLANLPLVQPVATETTATAISSGYATSTPIAGTAANAMLHQPFIPAPRANVTTAQMTVPTNPSMMPLAVVPYSSTISVPVSTQGIGHNIGLGAIPKSKVTTSLPMPAPVSMPSMPVVPAMSLPSIPAYSSVPAMTSLSLPTMCLSSIPAYPVGSTIPAMTSLPILPMNMPPAPALPACSTVPVMTQPLMYPGSSHVAPMSSTIPSLSSIYQPPGHPSVQGQPSFPGQQPYTYPYAPPVAPSQQQLLARQVMPKDLPPFRGDPEDWPLFYSAYISSTTACGYNEVENLARLQRALQGKAYEAVKSRLLLPACVPQVLSTLYMLFGRPELIIHNLLNKVREVPAPKPDRLETLITFGMSVQNLCDHLEAAGQVAHMCNPVLLQELVDKIPAQLRLDWALYKRNFPAVDLRTFSAYLSILVVAASDVTVIADTKSTKSSRSDKVKERNYLNAHSVEYSMKKSQLSKQELSSPVLCLACEDPQHKVKDCTIYKKMDPERRWKLVLDNHLCRSCLGKHGRRPCKIQTHCGTEGCQMRHHPLLHAVLHKQNKIAKEEPKPAGATGESSEWVNAHHNAKQSVLFKFLPVRLFWKGNSVETFAFLDDGSNMTLVEDWVAKCLGIDDGEDLPLCMSWTSNVTRYEPNSQRVSVEISGASQSGKFVLNDARTVKNLCLPKQSMNYEEMVQQHPHLKGLPLRSYQSASPGILIGSNNASLIAALKVKEGQLSDPIASKTRLGWTVSGMAEDGDSSVNVSLHICVRAQDSELHDMVKEFFSVDSVGVSADKGPESEDDKRARSILERTTRRVSKQYETGLLWRYDQFKFPDSFGMAKRRLECFERRMKADPELRESVHRQIGEYLQSGYIHLATPEELELADPARIWYLPLGAVRNPKKPGKIRLVWDAAAKAGGISFNSMLLKGPDLLTPLLTVLFGFRERKVAICGDLKQMFHQYRIMLHDTHSQRFLFRKDPSLPIQIYVMDVGTFGSTCSPSQAQFIKNLNAEEHKEAFPRGASAIIYKHYVDDYLDSFDSENEAIEVALEVKQVHANGGFTIRNWLSNSAEVLRRVGDPGPNDAKEIEISKDRAVERVLGMSWIPSEDQFTFNVDVDVDNVTPTKRNLLRCVMSVFDPLGLLSNFLVHGRIIIQDIWRTQAGWDEEVSGEIREKWRRWIAEFGELSKIRINRSYLPGFTSSEVGPLQLHIFTDASEDAYACVAYLRAEINGRVDCAVVMAKAKVAPLKALSIPRLELQGALLGARIAKTITEAHSLPIVRRVLWTDSETVLAWIRSDHRRYRQFVACRVGEILDKTNGEDWRWIPSKQNVADEATKWGKGPCLSSDARWIQGPEFLRLPEAEWPKKNTAEPSETAEELRACLVHREVVTEQLVDFSRFSRWERLLRAVAYVIRAFDNARRRKLDQPKETGALLQDELQRAEAALWRLVQAEVYPDEVAVLLSKDSANKEIDKTSKIYKLSPFADERNVVRVDSRIGAASNVSYDFKFPIILPRYHRLTELLVHWYHRKFLHANNETIVNEIRQRFQIPNLRTVVRQVSRNCQSCKIRKASPVTPKMGPLPAARLEQCGRPFTYVGIDYFGPISVKSGRSVVKRWVALFTCLSVRAIHMEIVHSLTTESCKMAIRRFVAYRGAPSEIYTDNGTNFQGASRELLQEIHAINNGLADTFTDTNTKWVFNPPSAPHFGGVWERLVRSVKVALESLSTLGKPDDETLRTIIAEVSAVINSRPLTFIPLESEDQEALTPNHFIHLSSDGVVRARKPLIESQRACRTNWDMARMMIDHFWKRWTQEYLPSISKRTKWFEEVKSPEVGDLVVLVDRNVRNGWIRGRIISVVTGRDGRVRQAVVQTANGILRRPVCKIAVLDVQPRGKTAPEANLQPYESGSVAGTGSTATSTPRPHSIPPEFSDRVQP